ncbi:MAG: hypothetical protein HKN59_04995 [Gammaproteobacteria bacterium]|nr:hypothetical protein [Gammaproteobacteria bacterium]
MRKNDSFREQLRRNSVALISLAVALAGLGYNTWRNEQTEMNRNVRHAAFEMLVRLGELQQVADHLHYGNDPEQGNPITGWGFVAVIRDLAMVMPKPVQESSGRLFKTWEAHWEGLGDSQKSIQAITDAVAETRASVVSELEALK